jgi:hypothetical protein
MAKSDKKSSNPPLLAISLETRSPFALHKTYISPLGVLMAVGVGRFRRGKKWAGEEGPAAAAVAAKSEDTRSPSVTAN